MAIFSLNEIFDIISMTIIVGYIFKDAFKAPKTEYEPLHHYQKAYNWDDYKFAIYAVAPAIIFHEFGHKFLALAFGLSATFKAAYFFLGLGLVLKLLNFPFIFFVPAYISILGQATPLQLSLTSFAGPAVNLILWLGSWLFLKYGKVKRKHIFLLGLTSKINMFLFIFNMLPIPGFDGFKVYSGLFEMLF